MIGGHKSSSPVDFTEPIGEDSFLYLVLNRMSRKTIDSERVFAIMVVFQIGKS